MCSLLRLQHLANWRGYETWQASTKVRTVSPQSYLRAHTPGLVGVAAAGSPGLRLAQLVEAVRCRCICANAHVVPKHACHLHSVARVSAMGQGQQW